MLPPHDYATYRFRRHHHRDHAEKGYLYTMDALDERSGEVLATCDVTGRPAQTALALTDAHGGRWHMVPNRRFMPTRWTVTGPTQQVVVQFEQKVLGKLVNPAYAVALTLLDSHDRELGRLMDPRASVVDRLLGLGPDEWAVLDGDRMLGKLAYLRRLKEAPTGFLGTLKSIMAGSDQGFVSMGPEHALAAPAALAMVLLFNQLTDAS